MRRMSALMLVILWIFLPIVLGCNYKFDGPIERFIMRAFWSLFDATDCNSVCKEKGFSGGNCLPSGSGGDRSSWCPEGQTCNCYWEIERKTKEISDATQVLWVLNNSGVPGFRFLGGGDIVEGRPSRGPGVEPHGRRRIFENFQKF